MAKKFKDLMEATGDIVKNIMGPSDIRELKTLSRQLTSSFHQSIPMVFAKIEAKLNFFGYTLGELELEDDMPPVGSENLFILSKADEEIVKNAYIVVKWEKLATGVSGGASDLRPDGSALRWAVEVETKEISPDKLASLLGNTLADEDDGTSFWNSDEDFNAEEGNLETADSEAEYQDDEYKEGAYAYNESVDIHNLGLGDKVTHAKHGVGTVSKVTEKPEVHVQFKTGTKKFHKGNAHELNESLDEAIKQGDRVERKDIKGKGRVTVLDHEPGFHKVSWEGGAHSIVNKKLLKKVKESLDESLEDDKDKPPIEHRSLYAHTYAKHGGTAALTNSAKEKAYATVEKKHGKEAVTKLKAWHYKNMNEASEDDIRSGKAAQDHAKAKKGFRAHLADKDAWANGVNGMGKDRRQPEKYPHPGGQRSSDLDESSSNGSPTLHKSHKVVVTAHDGKGKTIKTYFKDPKQAEAHHAAIQKAGKLASGISPVNGHSYEDIKKIKESADELSDAEKAQLGRIKATSAHNNKVMKQRFGGLPNIGGKTRERTDDDELIHQMDKHRKVKESLDESKGSEVEKHYKEHHKAIGDMLDRMVKEHKKTADPHQRNWGHVASIANRRSKLNDIHDDLTHTGEYKR